MADRVGLVSDEVVQAVGAVSVYEAVAHPLAGADGFIDVGHDFEGCFDTVVFDLAGLQCFDVVFAREAENVKGLFTGKCYKFPRLGPVYLWLHQIFQFCQRQKDWTHVLRINFYPPD